MIYTYGAKQPKRDHYSIFGQRPEYGGGIVAYFMTMDEERHFLALYTKHDPECRWSYEAPEGARVVK